MRKSALWPLLAVMFALTACPSAPGPVGAPTIVSFTATPANITAARQPVTLTWDISGGVTSLEIDGGIGAVSGTSKVVYPAATTTYTLTATNSSGSAEATAVVTLGPGGGGTPVEDGLPPSGDFGVSLDQTNFQSDQGGNITGADDPRIVRVEPGGTFYALVSYTDPGGIAAVDIFIANSNPPGLKADLVMGQAVAGFTLVGEVSGCVLDGTRTTVNCIYEIDVGDIPNIDQLEGAGSEFAYVFRTNVTDAAGNRSDSPPRGYVIVGGDGGGDGGGGTPNPPGDPPANRDPVAAFTSDETASDESGVTVKFSGVGSTDPDGDPLSYAWSFGDGTEANTRDFTKRYTEDGPYEVTLTVSDGAGGSDTETKTLEVDVPGDTAPPPPPEPEPEAPTIDAFTATPSTVEEGDDARLSWSVSGTVTSLSIDQGVGSVTGDEDVEVSPDETTTYTLTAQGAAGSDTASATVTVTDGDDDDGGGGTPSEAPVARIDYAPEEVVVGNIVTLDGSASSDPDGGGITAYAWVVRGPRGGTRLFTGSSPKFPAVSEGEYDVSLVVTDDEGEVSEVAEETFTAEEEDDDAPTPVTPPAPVTPPTPVMPPTPVTPPPSITSFTADGQDGLEVAAGAVVVLAWDISGEATEVRLSPGEMDVTADPDKEMTVTPTTDTTYTLRAKNGSEAAEPKQVTVTVAEGGGGGDESDLRADFDHDVEGLVATFTSTTEGSNGNVLSYSWDFGDGSLGGGSQTTHTYAEAGVYTVHLTVRTDDGVTARVNKAVTVPVPD